MGMGKEELRAKNAAQIAEAEKHRAELEAIAGRELSPNDLLMAWAEVKGTDFAADWKSSQDDFNRWTTGEELGHEPSPEECWQHHQEKVRAGEMRHHWSQTSNV